MPGVEHETYKGGKFSFTKFYRGLLESHKKATGQYSNDPSHDPWKESVLEKKICDEYAVQRGREIADYMAINKDYNATTGGQGGFIIPPEFTRELIDTVWPQMPIMNLPIFKIEGLRGELPVPKITGKPYAYHVGENGKPPESTGTLGLNWLRPRKVGAFSKQSQRLLYQSAGVSDQIIKYLLGQALAVEMNRGLTVGKGAGSEPKGLLTHTGFTNIASPVSKTALAIGTNGGRFTCDHAGLMQQALAAADEKRDTPTYGFLMRPEVVWGMKRERIQMYSGGTVKGGLPVNPLQTLMTDNQLEGIIGPYKHTTQIPATNVKGTSSTCSSVVFGDWSLFWVGTWRDVEFKVSDVAADGQGGSAFLQDQFYLVTFMEYDCMLMRESAMALISDAEANDASWPS